MRIFQTEKFCEFFFLFILKCRAEGRVGTDLELSDHGVGVHGLERVKRIFQPMKGKKDELSR